MKLYSYWRSATSYRVRIALNIKNVAYDLVPVDLLVGQQKEEHYKALNPICGVPTLCLPDGRVLTQSMAILDWIEAEYPSPPLLPTEPGDAAQVKAAAMVVACDIHPVNNLKVGKKLKEMGHAQSEVVAWMNDWMERGLRAYQALLPGNVKFSFGDTPGLSDICLVPQLYNARRWGCELASFSRLMKIEARCQSLSAFNIAHPENQPDAT